MMAKKTPSLSLDPAPFEKWYASADDLHIVYIAEVLTARER